VGLCVGGFFYAGELVEGLHLVFAVDCLDDLRTGCGVVMVSRWLAPVLVVVAGAVTIRT
jgi:hypothetical protein